MMMKTLRTTFVLLGCIALIGCGGGDADTDSDAAVAPADTLTRDQRDSLLGESRLPGAGGVRGARRVDSLATARAAAIDSLR